MRLACAGASDEDEIALLDDEGSAGQVAHESFVDWRVLEGEVLDVLGQRQLGDGELILDRARLLLGDLGLQEIADEALRLVRSEPPRLSRDTMTRARRKPGLRRASPSAAPCGRHWQIYLAGGIQSY